MEKKTIGQFIATLRKANGMTQKQLAERLNVSDKAVSRWERDESAPDLTLIPVIAEIFQVTSDELLRGEKKNVETVVDSRGAVEKTEKQIENLLKGVRMKLNTQGIIAVGIASIGLIIAMICNFAFYRAYLGFFIGSAFCLAAMICEIIFAMKAFYSVDNSEFASEAFGRYKGNFVTCIKRVVITIISELAFMCPLIVFPWDGYFGLLAATWFFYGAIFVAVALIICAFISWGVNIKLIKKCDMPEDKTAQLIATNKFRIKYTIIAVVALIVTFIAQLNFNDSVSAYDFAKGTTFDDIDKFVEYMETPRKEFIESDEIFVEEIELEYNDIVDNGSLSEEEMSDRDDYTFYDEFYTKETIYGKDEKTVIAEYTWRNEAVKAMHWEWDNNGEFVSVTTYTGNDYVNGSNVLDIINICAVFIYFIEVIVIAMIYKKKRKGI